MSFILKTFSKKAVAVVCAVAVLLSVMSVCFGAIASTPAAFTVTAARPAIPAVVGKGIDLNKIDVQFTGGTQNGADITWEALDASGGIVVDNNSKTVIYLKNGTYGMRATYGAETKYVYVTSVNAANESVIYEKTFSSADITSTGFVANSDWTHYSNVEITDLDVVYGGIGTNPGALVAQNMVYYLKPNTAAGQMVSAFADITVETVSTAPCNAGILVGPFLRMNVGNDNVFTNTEGETFIYPGLFTRSSFDVQGNDASWMRIWYGNGVRGDGDRWNFPKYTDGDTEKNFNFVTGRPPQHVVTTRATVTGTTIVMQYTTTNGSTTVTSNPLTVSKNSTAVPAAGGTIGYGTYASPETRAANLRSIKAIISFTADEVEAIEDYSFDVNLLSSSKPAIPAKVNTLYDLKDIFFPLSNGGVAKGDTLTWTADNSDAVIAGSKVGMLKEGLAVLTGTDASSNTATVYLMTVDGNNEAVIFDYTFSAADAGLAVTDSNAKPVWSYSGTGSWGWQTATNNPYTTKLPRLRNDSGAGVIYLNPESEAGKIVSSFADYTFYLTAVTHENWTAQSKYFPMLTRYNMAGSSYNLSADTYLGYRAYFSTTGGAVYVGGNAVATATKTYPYTNSYPHVDFKLQVEGDEVIFSAKPANTVAYTEVFKMSEADAVPDAVTSTVGRTGTIGVYTDTQNRPSLQKAKVTVSFDESEFLAGTRVITENNPVLPAKVNTFYNLADEYFVLSNGSLVKGSALTWTTADTSKLFVKGANVSALEEGTVAVTGTDASSNTITIYLVTTDDNNGAVVLDYTFSAADTGLAATDSNGVAIWAGTGSTNWNWLTTTPKGLNPRLRLDSDGFIYLNPNSEYGKVVSSFSDYTVTITAATHENWVASTDKNSVQIVGRYNMAGSAYSAANDTYIGYSIPFRNSAGGLFIGGTTASAGAVANWGYDSNNPNVDFKMEIKGKEFIFSAKSTAASEYTQIYKMTEDANAPAAALATAGVTGTIGVYSNNLARPSLQKAKVEVTFNDSDYLAVSNFKIVAKPAAPTNTALTYNGENQTVAVAGDEAYVIDGNVAKNAGNYTITVALKDKENSMWADGTTDDLTFTYVINKKDVTVKADAKEKEMGKADPALTFTAEGLVGSETLTGALTRAAGETVGTYAIAQGTVTNENNPNYNITFVAADFKITKTNQATLEITNKPTTTIVYGNEFTLGTSGGSGEGAITWEITSGNATVENGKVKVTGVGDITVKVTKAGDNNYEPASATYTFTAIKATPDLGTVTVSGTVTDKTAPADVVLNKTSGPDGKLEITDAAMLANKTSYAWKFTPNDTANYEVVTGTITINVADATYPTAAIKVDGNEATADSAEIDFLFVGKADREITITAADNENGSGIASIKYFVSDKEIAANKLNTLAYEGYNGAFSVSEGKSIIYVEVKDNAGNTSYYMSDGIIVDKTAPVIKDIEDGDEFDGDVVIEVSDELSGVVTVKVDGTSVDVVNGKFTVAANDADRTITVIDKAGNVTEIEIKLNIVYTATFKGENGVITTITLKPGEELTMPAVPTKEGYTVTWDKTLDKLTENVIINAVYTKIETEVEADKEAKPESPKTNDITNLWFWVVALVVSGAVLTISLKAKKVK